MHGTVAITDFGWYEFLLQQPNLDEVNFWTPSASHTFHAEPTSPFFFKLKAKYHHAICGYGHFFKFERLPDSMAWGWFGPRNGCPTFEVMRERIETIRQRFGYRGHGPANEIGCILIVQPVFFAKDDCVTGPRDWPERNLRHMRYDLAEGEGRRIWDECLLRTTARPPVGVLSEGEAAPDRYGAPVIVHPRLGQGTFRVAVMDAYHKACAVTGEHSVPALDASHIRPFGKGGPNEIRNGLLLRADLHRLFDQGPLTVTADLHLEVSPRLRTDYRNGRSYYPLHGSPIAVPDTPDERPASEFVRWHNENVFLAA
jgi:putative restriction endonuclease